MVALMLAAHAGAGGARNVLSIPEIATVKSGVRCTVTVDDLAAVRAIDSLSVSPDGQRYAILVRQGDPANNEYRLAWFSGNTRNGSLIRLGEGGEAHLRVMPTGHMPGQIESNVSRWSPDGQWLAYTLRQDQQVQLWRSRSDGSLQEQLTNNAADVREFAWREDGKALYFSVGTPRAELRAREQAKSWQGYRYDEDLWAFTDLLGPQLIRPLEADPRSWVVRLADRQERLATESERAAFAHALASNAVDIDCSAAECAGARKTWWSEDRRRVMIWRGEGINEAGNGFYSWTPASGTVSRIMRLRDDELQLCSEAAAERLICVRQTASQPAHVVAIDLRSASMQVLADVNPEFRNLRLGKVERFEWDTPKFRWNESGGELAGLYPPRAYGYILYPPDFDPARKYPVFIDPYVASGFAPLGAEHPLHAYAASGFVVLRTAFPQQSRASARGIGMQQLYSAELGYPHLSMLMESTLRALDAVAERGFIDEHRVGIGGVSHGTFVPLYMLQKYDRIAAISISSPHWGPLQYYWSTQKARDATAAYETRTAGAVHRGPDFWNDVDIADRVEAIEAPILMQLAAHETYALVRLIRNLADAGKPYDAYVFPAETHIKWQSAHLHAIAGRNLDWFRFWLQDFEDPDPAKAEQYLRWRKLREQQRAAAGNDRSGN